MDLVNLIGATALFLLIAYKHGALDWYEAVRRQWMPEAGCYLCLSFWSALILQIATGGNLWLSLTAAPFTALIVYYARHSVDRKDDR